MHKITHTNQWHKNTLLNIVIHTKHNKRHKETHMTVRMHTHTLIGSHTCMHIANKQHTHKPKDTEKEFLKAGTEGLSCDRE